MTESVDLTLAMLNVILKLFHMEKVF